MKKRIRDEKPQNILLLIPSMGVGGSEQSVSSISTLLDAKYNMYVAVFRADNLAYLHGGTLIDLQNPASKTKGMKPIIALRRVIALRKAVRQYDIDIVIGFTVRGCFYTGSVQKRCIRVLSIRGFGEMVNREAFFARILTKCDHILFNSYGSKDWFSKRHPLLAHKMTAIQNCFDIALITNRAAQPVDSRFTAFTRGRPVIVSVGRMCEVKGFDFLIKAFLLLRKRMPDVVLVLVGDGPDMPQLQKLAKDGNADENILFTGMQKNPLPYVKNSTLYVLPSRTEGFPNALVEAMACGTPVVCTNCSSGPNEILHDDFMPDLYVDGIYIAPYGVMVPPIQTPADDCVSSITSAHDVLAQAMEMMLSDATLRERIGQAAQSRALMFSFENSQANYVSFIDALWHKAVKVNGAQ